ncbi:recombinase family protein [Mucilaginibacter ginsenosidivorans]|uniref:Recombinase family protein n=1 Tax=Mucilaginibacter ginsenosidivorans TaxID=398053 RepID=A0A5B8US85_9SPHI|nr:recombinase family protein [Mucilaginibacter ginsenosidivorans]QEC61728.1 recombinase family protein [Mucilaginibacter ginsenosidivorans]
MAIQKRVGIWIRVSTDMQVKDDSPEHHEQRARYYAQSHDWQVMEVYRLDAVSGKSVMQHPEAQRMLADIRSGHITGLVFSKLARLARSTKELLEFAEIFRQEGADLVSLSENIDTSSPAGRLFFTIISAMAEWEREEIAARVAASVPIRAKLGKSLGGQAPFGYQWSGKEFVVNTTEAPVRALMYQLFLQLQRKKSTAQELNRRGYRTRNGTQFTATTVSRLLRDSTAKGERRANYTQTTGNNKQWVLKPQSEWVIIPCESIISPELWEQCNGILDNQEAKRRPRGPKPVYLLSGFVKCSCGTTMYVYQSSKNYACKRCKTRISVADIDEIYQVYLKEYLSGINREDYLRQSDQQLQEKKQLLEVTVKERTKLAKRITELVDLRLDGSLTKERYTEQYTPLEERMQQLDVIIPELEAEIDVRNIQLISSDVVLTDAKTLYDEWGSMSLDQKRAIVEVITSKVEITKQDITITLAYATPPSSKSREKVSPRHGFMLAISITFAG